MSMIASSRERRRSACPLSRRSLGRIVPSDATTESRPAIRGNRKNEIASFPAFKPKKLAISNLAPLQKSTPAQWLGRLFTADQLKPVVMGPCFRRDDDGKRPVSRPHAYLPWQCLYFLPEPQGQSSLRPTLPQVAGFLGSRLAVAAGTSEAPANASSSSPVLGSNLWASIGGNTGCCCSGGTISTRINCAVTASRKCAIIASNRLKASDLYSCSGSRWP